MLMNSKYADDHVLVCVATIKSHLPRWSFLALVKYDL